jgi:hypothetical protein
MIVLGIDPGMTVGIAVLDTEARTCLHSAETTDALLLYAAGGACPDVVVAELWVNYGRPPGEGSRMAIGQAYWLKREHGAQLLSRPEVIRALGMAGSVGKAAVWGEVVRLLGSDKPGKLCPKRANKSHSATGSGCSGCSGTGWQRSPGPLAHVRGHARDALALAVAWAIIAGLMA